MERHSCSKILLQLTSTPIGILANEDSSGQGAGAGEFAHAPRQGVTAGDQLRSLESALLGLSRDEATPGLAEMVAAMRVMVLEKMLPEVWAAHNASVAAVDAFDKAFKGCEADRNLGADKVVQLTELVGNRSTEHQACRAAQADAVADNASSSAELASRRMSKETSCARRDTLLGSISEKFEESKPKAGEAYEAYILRNQKNFNKWAAELTDAEERCANATAALEAIVPVAAAKVAAADAKRAGCSMPQRKLESTACERLAKASDTCEAYDSCYRRAKGAYKSGRLSLEQQEAYRKDEWHAIKRIECLLNAFQGNISNTKIELCKNETHGTSSLDVAYFDVIEPVACSTAFSAPCTSEWIYLHYGNLSAGGRADACLPCPGAATTTTTLPTTTTTTTTKLMGKHAVFDHSSFIFSENCQPWAAACQAKGLQPPSMKTMQMTWNQAACDAIAQGLGKTCSLGDYDNGATAMWCKRGTDACGTHGWGDNFDNYGLYNSDYGCVYHCALRSLPKSSDGKIILDPESYSGTYGYGVQVPYSGGSCPDGGRPIGMAHDVAGAKYDITIPATGLVSVSVQWGISGASDKSYLQWDRAPTASDNILVVGEESNNQLKTSSPVSLSAGSHTLWLGSAADGNYYTLPWCKIIVNLS